MSLRRVSPDGEAGSSPAGATDVVGRLLLWTDGELWVRRNDTRVVAVPEAELVSGVVIPEHPRPGHVRDPQPSVEWLQRAADRGWPAEEQEPLGPWVARAHRGVTRRANSVLAPGDLPRGDLPDAVLEALLDGVAAWYARRGLPVLVQAPGGGPVDVALAARGWVRGEATLFQTAAVSAVLTELGSGDAAPAHRLVAGLGARPDDAWYAVDGDPDPVREAILTAPPTVGFVTVRGPDGEPWGVGRASVVDGWAGLTSLATAPHARRGGVGREVLRALLTWAGAEGAHSAYLQARTASTAARALYAGSGFTTHHTYGYLTPPAP